MAFREVRVFEVREVLRPWLQGEGQRAISRRAGMDRKTVRRYIDAVVELGFDRDGGDGQLTDVLIGLVVEGVRPHRGEQALRAPAPTSVYDVPIYATAKVHRDHYIEVAKALYSIPQNLIGTRVDVRADRSLVRVFSRGQFVKDRYQFEYPARG